MRSAIKNRVSRRKFEDTTIPIPVKDQIKALVSQSNAISGLSLEFIEDGRKAFDKLSKSYGLFTHVRSLILMKGNTDDVHLKEKIGYYGEDLVLSITDLNLGTCWVGGTFDKREFPVNENEELLCVLVVGKVAPPSLGEKIVRSATHVIVKRMEERIDSDQELPQWLQLGMNAVLLAPSAKNSQKVNFKYKEGVLSAHTPDDYVLDLVDLGIAKKHFELEAGGEFEMGNGGIFHLK